MTRRFLTLSFILVLSLALAACSPGSNETANTSNLPTATPAPTEPPVVPTATFLPEPTVTPFPEATPGGGVSAPGSDEEAASTDGDAAPGETNDADAEATASADLTLGEREYFSGFESGWPTVDEGDLQVFPADGKYVFAMGPDTMTYLNTTSVDAASAYIEVEATPQGCPTGGGYGIFFRFRDTSNYYALTIFCNNRMTVYTRSGGALVTDPLVDVTLPAGLDASSNTAHKIGVLMQGSNFDLYFDGQYVTSFTDGRHSRGDVAVYAVSPGSDELRVLFDNLGVWATQ